jgi:hypothetical protein
VIVLAAVINLDICTTDLPFLIDASIPRPGDENPGEPEWDRFIAALKEKHHAVMTRGDATDAAPTTALGLYAMDSTRFEVTGRDLRFRVTKRRAVRG